MVRNHMCNFGRGHYGKHSSEIILNLDQWFNEKVYGHVQRIMDA